MKKISLSIICYLAGIFFIQAQTLFGTTYSGGTGGGGTIFKLPLGTNNLNVVHPFEGNLSYLSNPGQSALIQATDGNLYGVAPGTGYNNGGIFSYNQATGIYKKVKQFNGIDGGGPAGGLVQASDGKLYGATKGGGNYN